MLNTKTNDLSLSELFQMTDSIGDKYLTDDELAKRSAELLKAQTELDKIAEELMEVYESESGKK